MPEVAIRSLAIGPEPARNPREPSSFLGCTAVLSAAAVTLGFVPRPFPVDPLLLFGLAVRTGAPLAHRGRRLGARHLGSPLPPLPPLRRRVLGPMSFLGPRLGLRLARELGPLPVVGQAQLGGGDRQALPHAKRAPRPEPPIPPAAACCSARRRSRSRDRRRGCCPLGRGGGGAVGFCGAALFADEHGHLAGGALLLPDVTVPRHGAHTALAEHNAPFLRRLRRRALLTFLLCLEDSPDSLEALDAKGLALVEDEVLPTPEPPVLELLQVLLDAPL
mmetsp:Transcript_21429/g.48365  ORF Transcript_21429/g.48365 Transcript_21429/m.48365 type:complete len:276 (-) Transcript_21429:152-979(-)